MGSCSRGCAPRSTGGCTQISFHSSIPTAFSMSRATNIPEQDVGAGEGDNLPTYENLAEAHGPNSRYDRGTAPFEARSTHRFSSSRFGRWKGWVEKR